MYIYIILGGKHIGRKYVHIRKKLYIYILFLYMGRSKRSHVRLDTGWACGLQHALPTYSQVPLNVTSIDRFVHSQYVDRQCPPDIVVFDEGRTLEASWSQLYHCPYQHCTPHKLAPWRVMSFKISWSIYAHLNMHHRKNHHTSIWQWRPQ